MSNQLIPIQQTRFNGELQETVDARTLHERLGSQQHFADWIKARIEECQHVQGIDFVIIHEKHEKVGMFGMGRPRIDYALTIDAAKEICVMERNDQGRQYRRYLINSEKHAKVQHQHTQALAAEVLKTNPRLQDVLNLTLLGYSQARQCKMLGIGEKNVRRCQVKLRSFGLLPQPGKGLVVAGGRVMKKARLSQQRHARLCSVRFMMTVGMEADQIARCLHISAASTRRATQALARVAGGAA